MREYKREKTHLESQLAEVQKKAIHHDDNLRALDVWFLQVRTLCWYLGWLVLT